MDIIVIIIETIVSFVFPHIKYFDDKKNQAGIENCERYPEYIKRMEEFNKNDPVSKFIDKFFS